MDLFDCFDRAVIINLPQRKDRRRAMERQLELAGISKHSIEFFPAIRPTILEDWPTLGTRGCFLSHYAVLRKACDDGVGAVAVIEDDCDFEPCFGRVQQQLAEQLTATNWGLMYFGHWEPSPAGTPTGLRICTVHCTAHFYAIHGRVLPTLVSYLEAVLSRPGGHPLGGPQHFDGALMMFRDQHPDVPVHLAFPNLGRQRRSRSDINPHWYDKVPLLRDVANEVRHILDRGGNSETTG